MFSAASVIAAPNALVVVATVVVAIVIATAIAVVVAAAIVVAIATAIVVAAIVAPAPAVVVAIAAATAIVVAAIVAPAPAAVVAAAVFNLSRVSLSFSFFRQRWFQLLELLRRDRDDAGAHRHRLCRPQVLQDQEGQPGGRKLQQVLNGEQEGKKSVPGTIPETE